MALREQLNDSMKEAMKAKDAKRLATVRLILAALKDRDIAARTESSRDLLGDDEILGLMAKMIKQREESATAFDAGKRPELAAGEREEIAIIRAFMPAQMDEAAMKEAAQEVIAEIGAASIKDMGKVMAVMKERYAGQMDFARASALIVQIERSWLSRGSRKIGLFARIHRNPRAIPAQFAARSPRLSPCAMAKDCWKKSGGGPIWSSWWAGGSSWSARAG